MPTVSTFNEKSDFKIEYLEQKNPGTLTGTLTDTQVNPPTVENTDKICTSYVWCLDGL